ncbi:hypothetical protein V3C99_011846 [Haemonchus contortus]
MTEKFQVQNAEPCVRWHRSLRRGRVWTHLEGQHSGPDDTVNSQLLRQSQACLLMPDTLFPATTAQRNHDYCDSLLYC